MKLPADWVWARLDALAQDRAITVSALAKRAGLDPTSFNKSKRVRRDGLPRWPTMSSIARVLDALDMTLVEFADWSPD
ncbi:MAG: helix-turn-helix domain-containing protein [Hyphomicrobiaceae bacterium]